MKKASLTILLLLMNFSLVVPASAQEATRQRTTGTYLPVLAQDKFSKQFDANQGGSVYLDDGGAEVVIPDNFYDKKITISVRRVKWQDNSAVPALNIDGESFIGQDVFEITAVDPETKMPVIEFDKTLKIIFRYFDSEVEGFNEDEVKIRFFDRLALEWKDVPSQIDADSNSIEVYVDHLTLFAMTGAPTNGKVSVKKDDGADTGTPLWQKVLLVLGLLVLSGIGGWFVYTTYTQARQEMEMEGGLTIAGGSRDQSQQTAPTTTSPKQPESGSVAPSIPVTPGSESPGDEKKSDGNDASDGNNEIWIDF